MKRGQAACLYSEVLLLLTLKQAVAAAAAAAVAAAAVFLPLEILFAVQHITRSAFAKQSAYPLLQKCTVRQ